MSKYCYIVCWECEDGAWDIWSCSKSIEEADRNLDECRKHFYTRDLEYHCYILTEMFSEHTFDEVEYE